MPQDDTAAAIPLNADKIPIDRTRRGRPPRKGGHKYPFSQMEVGDSFDVPLPDKHDRTVAAQVTAATHDYKNRAGFPKDTPPFYTVRTYRNIGPRGIVRCWRVE